MRRDCDRSLVRIVASKPRLRHMEGASASGLHLAVPGGLAVYDQVIGQPFRRWHSLAVAGQAHDSFALTRRQDDDPEVFVR